MSILSQPDLALKVLAGEATSEEAQELRRELEKSPEAQSEYEDLKGVFQLLHTTAPLTDALQARDPVLPAHALESLHTARRRVFREQARRAQAPSFSLSAYLAGHLSLILRIVFACGAMVVLFISMQVSNLSDGSVEVGMYREDSTRGGEQPFVNGAGDLTGLPLPGGTAHTRAVKVQLFDLDQPFDQWKTRLAWYQHGKIWIDNEKNLLHILSRNAQGESTERTEPLATTDAQQHEQILKAVDELRR